MIPTRALQGARSVWKGPNIVPLPIIRPVPGLKFQIYNGKTYHDVTITEDMVGHKLGEFSPTRKKFSYKQSKN